MIYEITWAEEYGARFKKLDARDVEVWEEILANEIHNLGTGEIAKAVKLLGEQKQQGRFKFAPTIEDLKAAIIKNRWLARIQRDGYTPARAACALCGGNGWMAFGASIKTQINAIELGAKKHLEVGNEWGFYTMAIPCLCSRGQRQLTAYPEAHREKIMAMARDVMGWKKNITGDSPYDDRRFAVDEGIMNYEQPA